MYQPGARNSGADGSGDPTPRYDYNQIMYRLDLADERLKAAQSP